MKYDTDHPKSRSALLALILLALSVASCGARRLNVMETQNQTLMATGYSADRSQSILRSNNEALEYCDREKKNVVLIKQDTVYQGRYPEGAAAAAATAGRVADALGREKVADASGALSSPTDYKTTFEFRCR